MSDKSYESEMIATTSATSSYQRVSTRDEANSGDASADFHDEDSGSSRADDDADETPGQGFLAAALPSSSSARHPLANFLVMSFLFSANHGCVVSCMALASARLGSVGAWQSGLLMFSYAASSLLGATYAVKTMGARNSLALGMLCYCAYVGCFWIAAHVDETDVDRRAVVAYTGALIGGVGAGFLWTAQGTYFGLASQDYASRASRSSDGGNGDGESEAEWLSATTARFAGYFAFLYLTEELFLRLLSSALLQLELASWGAIFGIYTLITVASAVAVPCWVHDYPAEDATSHRPDENHSSNGDEGENEIEIDGGDRVVDHKNSIFYKVTVAFYLLRDDPKMKYMIGLNAVFGFVAAFLNSYVNGQVVPVALDDPDSKYIGVLNSMVSAVAAAASLVFGKLAASSSGGGEGGIGAKGAILVFGALCFGGVVLPFCIQPDAAAYAWPSLTVVYALHGLGRATFEGTLRSTFADYFREEKEGAFANIIFQNGVASGIGYILTFSLVCDTPSRYCIEYSDGRLHDVLTFELVALVSVVVAIGGYLRASHLHRAEQERRAGDGYGYSRLRREAAHGDGRGGAAGLLRASENGVPA